MASDQMPAILVARFLKAHHFNKTLEAFLRESNLQESLATTNQDDWTLESLIREKVQFDKSLSFEKTGNEPISAWTKPAPSQPTEPMTVATNVLSVKADPDGSHLAITTADNTCTWVKGSRPCTEICGSIRADSPVLSIAFLEETMAAFTTMSGKVSLVAPGASSVLVERRDHSKWAVNVAVWKSLDVWILATAGWDQKVNIYRVDEQFDLQAPQHSISLESNPEGLVFVKHPDTEQLYLVVSRRDSSFLYYYRIQAEERPNGTIKVEAAGRQNLAPHSNAWVAFTPSALALHPTDHTLLAIGTSHLPHMKVMIVRLLFPDATAKLPLRTEPQTAAASARADLALQDREDAAISLHVSVQAPQTPYSTPQIAWRPDGSGLWTNGDDGVIRGVEAKSGKVITLLRGHEAGSKVRTLWAGRLKGSDNSEPREVLVSGGFDRKVFVWEIVD